MMTPARLAMCEELRRVYLGLSVRSMMDAPGMMILLVNTESPAWRGEMKVGDILMEIEGKPINLINELYDAIADAHGKSLSFKINRKGAEVLCYVTFPHAA